MPQDARENKKATIHNSELLRSLFIFINGDKSQEVLIKSWVFNERTYRSIKETQHATSLHSVRNPANVSYINVAGYINALKRTGKIRIPYRKQILSRSALESPGKTLRWEPKQAPNQIVFRKCDHSLLGHCAV
jgi:hypothetical protein